MNHPFKGDPVKRQVAQLLVKNKHITVVDRNFRAEMNRLGDIKISSSKFSKALKSLTQKGYVRRVRCIEHVHDKRSEPLVPELKHGIALTIVSELESLAPGEHYDQIEQSEVWVYEPTDKLYSELKNSQDWFGHGSFASVS